jgi:hypothetical protein
MPKHEPAPASYTIRAEAADDDTQDLTAPHPGTGIRVYMAATGAVITAIALALVLTIAGLMHADNVNAGQAAQIRGLDAANARLSGQLSVVAAALAGQDPAADPALITCADLRQMALTLITGGSVSAVPGPVSLATAPVRLPGHCAKR